MDFHDFMYSTHREGKADTDSDSSDDSNDENNWRNDYPDEDEYGGSSIDDDDMRRAVEEFDLSEFPVIFCMICLNFSAPQQMMTGPYHLMRMMRTTTRTLSRIQYTIKKILVAIMMMY